MYAPLKYLYHATPLSAAAVYDRCKTIRDAQPSKMPQKTALL